MKQKLHVNKRNRKGVLSCENDSRARREIRIKPLMQTNLGAAQTVFDLKRRPYSNTVWHLVWHLLAPIRGISLRLVIPFWGF